MSAVHVVSITTRLDDEGTPDERRVVDKVRFTCTAAEDADCRRHPAQPDCYCEIWDWSKDDTHDSAGHEILAGQQCWLVPWFETGYGAIYTGVDGDDMRDDYVPAIDRAGAITAGGYDGDFIEWEFTTDAEVSS